jgi:hypothetical protein
MGGGGVPSKELSRLQFIFISLFKFYSQSGCCLTMRQENINTTGAFRQISIVGCAHREKNKNAPKRIFDARLVSQMNSSTKVYFARTREGNIGHNVQLTGRYVSKLVSK